VRWILGRLDGIGARPRVLKVIPAEDARSQSAWRPQPSPGIPPEVRELLAHEVAAGSEIVLHGYTHRRDGAIRGAWYDRVRGRLFARESAEFLGLDASAMRERLVRGRDWLTSAGVSCGGFCAPGWLATAELVPLLLELGFRYDLRYASIRDLRTGRVRFVPAVGYMGADRLQEALIGAEAGLLMAAEPLLPALRVFLHPVRASRSPACRRTLRLIERLLRTRTPVTYTQLLDA
jgi:predicted deacetylase